MIVPRQILRPSIWLGCRNISVVPPGTGASYVGAHSEAPVEVQQALVLEAEKKVDRLPFLVRRTKAGNLPIYLKTTHAGTRVYTIFRKIEGNKAEFKKEVEAICETKVIARDGWLCVQGNFRHILKTWMEGIGM
eukprot:Platyproteum_vivax@DN3364_c0_g1_i1.p1